MASFRESIFYSWISLGEHLKNQIVVETTKISLEDPDSNYPLNRPKRCSFLILKEQALAMLDDWQFYQKNEEYQTS